MDLKNKEVFLSEIKNDKDSYVWSELNCFYRTFAIVLKSKNESFYDLLLIYISAYVSYVVNGERNLSFNAGDNILRFYNSELRNIFGAEIKKNDFSSLRNMKTKIMESLIHNEVVIVPCDLYYLPYCKTYLDLHKRHYLIIKGFNKDKQIYYILDNMQNDLGSSTDYTDFMIKMCDVFTMCDSFKKNFDYNSMKKYFWSIDIKKVQLQENIVKKYLSKLCLKMTSYDIQKSYEYLLINELKTEIFNRDLLHYMEYVNIKKLLFSSIKEYVTSNYQYTEDIHNLINLLDLYIEEREKIKLLFAVTYQRKIQCSKELENQVLKILNKEKQIFHQLNRVIESCDKIYTKEKQKEFTVVNHNKAEINCVDNQIDISLEENIIYDIWKNANNGVQIYKKLDNERKAIDIEMKMNCLFGGTVQCGILLIMDNGNKILFGSLGKLNIAIHELSDKPDYELHIENYTIDDKYVNLKVEISEDEYLFIADRKIIFKLNTESKIKYYGIFAKTWEKCRCNVSFRIRDEKNNLKGFNK